jgi:hypothetical protein
MRSKIYLKYMCENYFYYPTDNRLFLLSASACFFLGFLIDPEGGGVCFFETSHSEMHDVTTQNDRTLRFLFNIKTKL